MRLPATLRELFRTALDLFYPPQCAFCGTQVSREKQLCGDCLQSAPRITAPFCRVCSQPFEGVIEGAFTCPNCHDRQFDFECAVAVYRSRDVVRELIHRFKYNREYRLRLPLAQWLGEALQDGRLVGKNFDAIVPVPLHPTRKRHREFNQAEVLAKNLAESRGIPQINALRRVRNTDTQTHFDRHERMENLRNAFVLAKNTRVKNMILLLVDDVFTTGSTVQECARVLRRAGAQCVYVITVGRG